MERERWPDVMTVREAAAYLRANPRTIYALLAFGRLRGVRIGQQRKPGRAWRIAKTELDRFLTSGEAEGAWAYGGRPIVKWRCKECGEISYIEEFTTGGQNPPNFCSGCGTKVTPGNLGTPDNMVYEGRYEAAQPWHLWRKEYDERPGRAKR